MTNLDVIVVGAGPAGLTAAHYLSRRGCQVTVLEAEKRPGGMLSCVIPSYRLPREVIDGEVEIIVRICACLSIMICRTVRSVSIMSWVLSVLFTVIPATRQRLNLFETHWPGPAK